jgi:hypothetical protein
MMDRILSPDTTRLDATVFREQASYDHIKLTSLTVGHAFKFFQDLDRYESRYKTSVPAPTLVSDRVRDEILVEAPHVTITEFYGLENSIALMGRIVFWMRTKSRSFKLRDRDTRCFY